MVHPYWVGHSGVTNAHFGLTAYLALWLITYVQVACVILNAVLILGVVHWGWGLSSGVVGFYWCHCLTIIVPW